jgi:hypothetical protein
VPESFAPALPRQPAFATPFAGAEPALVCYGAALSVAVALLIYRPLFDIPNEAIGSIRYLPHLLAFVAVAFDCVGDPLALRRIGAALRGFWPIAALMAWMLVGAVITRFQLGQQDTYLAHGLSYAGFFAAYPFAAKLAGRRGLPWALRPLLIGGLAAFALVPFTFAIHRPLLHESSFVFIPWMAYVMLRPGALRPAAIALGALALLAVGPLSLKNTATVVAAMTLGGVYVAAHARWYGLGRTLAFLRTWLLIGGVAAVLGLAWALAPRPEGFSTGNAEFRTFIYETRWQQFLDSPIVGNAWIGPPYIRFTLFQMSVGSITMSNAVTHNDHLDLLANGGLVAAALILAFSATLARRVVRALRGELDGERSALVATLALCVVAGLFTMAFNPVLGNATNGFMLWTLFGLLAGYLHDAARPASAPPRAG